MDKDFTNIFLISYSHVLDSLSLGGELKNAVPLSYFMVMFAGSGIGCG